MTLGILFAWKDVGEHAFYRWLSGNCEMLFLRIPKLTRLFRALKTHRD